MNSLSSHNKPIKWHIPSKYTSEISKQSRVVSLFSQYGIAMLYTELLKITNVHKLFRIFTKNHENFTATILGILDMNKISMKLMRCSMI